MAQRKKVSRNTVTRAKWMLDKNKTNERLACSRQLQNNWLNKINLIATRYTPIHKIDTWREFYLVITFKNSPIGRDFMLAIVQLPHVIEYYNYAFTKWDKMAEFNLRFKTKSSRTIVHACTCANLWVFLPNKVIIHTHAQRDTNNNETRIYGITLLKDKGYRVLWYYNHIHQIQDKKAKTETTKMPMICAYDDEKCKRVQMCE